MPSGTSRKRAMPKSMVKKTFVFTRVITLDTFDVGTLKCLYDRLLEQAKSAIAICRAGAGF